MLADNGKNRPIEILSPQCLPFHHAACLEAEHLRHRIANPIKSFSVDNPAIGPVRQVVEFPVAVRR